MTTALKNIFSKINNLSAKEQEDIYQMLKLYVEEGSESLMTKEQKSEIDKLSKLYHQGKLKSSSWEEVKQRTRASR